MCTLFLWWCGTAPGLQLFISIFFTAKTRTGNVLLQYYQYFPQVQDLVVIKIFGGSRLNSEFFQIDSALCFRGNRTVGCAVYSQTVGFFLVLWKVFITSRVHPVRPGLLQYSTGVSSTVEQTGRRRSASSSLKRTFVVRVSRSPVESDGVG